MKFGHHVSSGHIDGTPYRPGPVERAWLYSPDGKSRKAFVCAVDACRWANLRSLVGCTVVGRESGALLATIEAFSWDSLVETAKAFPTGRAASLDISNVRCRETAA
jgi:hypothetical protein